MRDGASTIVILCFVIVSGCGGNRPSTADVDAVKKELPPNATPQQILRMGDDADAVEPVPAAKTSTKGRRRRAPIPVDPGKTTESAKHTVP